MRLAIHGVGVLGGFGCGINDLKSALAEGKCNPDTVTINAGRQLINMPVFSADTGMLSSFFNNRALRRVDHFSRMALLGACLALEDADMFDAAHKTMGVIVATGYGAMQSTFALKDSINSFGDSGSSPTKFSNSVHNAPAAHLSVFLKATAANLTVSQFDMSVSSAILTACGWLEEKRVDSVLLGGVDEYCDVLGYCRHRLFQASLSKNHENVQPVILPFEFEKQTAIAGEGAAFFILKRASDTPAPYGYITDIKVSACGDHTSCLAEKDFLILGADGHKKCGKLYPAHISGTNNTASYTPLYGSLPVGQGFDIAVSAVSIREKLFFASPGYLSDNRNNNLQKIYCLKLGSSGEYSGVTLEANS